MSTARLREVLNAKDKGPPSADGTLSIAADASEAELTARRNAVDYVATTSNYLEDDAEGLRPSDLFGKITWKIERFSEVSKRELRSSVFEVGQYKWYILIYPHGCDVCNHLSLFLCVADYDKLLPGWSHFAQFTIAVVNKDPKKSKYSDTLHRFCKKEHDWGWKKFMELTKVLDGFAVNDTLTIKAQVQVIRDNADRPFRCLDPFYRQDLVRVYLSNVEGVCRKFIEQKRGELSSFRARSEPFKAFWKALDGDMKKGIVTEAEDVILKGLVKHFFNEKEVTSTLIMDAIFCGCKQIEEDSHKWLEGSRNGADAPIVLINTKAGGFFALGVDVLHVLESAAYECVASSSKDDKEAEGPHTRSHQTEESIKDSIVRDEHRLAELGRKTVEIYVVSHIFSEHIEITYQYAECLKRQDELLREEEEDEKREQLRKRTKAQNEKDKRAKRQEKKKEKERKKKEKEDAERQRQEEERKKEAERKRIEEQQQKRLQEEKREKEHQQALEKAKQRAEERQREESEKKRAQEKAEQQRKCPSPAEKGNQKIKAQHARSKSVSAAPEISKKTSSLATAERTGFEKRMETHVKTFQQRCTPVESAASVKQREENKKLQAKIHVLEKQLTDRDAQVKSLQQQVDRLKKREKQLESELSKRPLQLPESKSVQSNTESKPISTTAKGAERAQPEAQRLGQSTPSSRMNKSESEAVQPETGPVEGRSHSSGDETCSDLTFIEHSRCASQILCSVDASQVSDCNTHETRSLSSFGTQMDHNGAETDSSTVHDGYRCSRGFEAADGRMHHHGHGHSHSMVHSHLPAHARSYPTQQINQARANSVASCIPARQQSLNTTPAMYSDNGVARSYSLDGNMEMFDNGHYANGPGYHDYATLQDQLSFLCSSMQGIPCPEFQSPDSSIQQPEMQTMCDGNALDDFAHFSLIKDLLD